MNNILSIIDDVPSNVQEYVEYGTVTDEVLAQKANTTNYLNEIADNGGVVDCMIFDDYAFMNSASATLKRDADKIQNMYYTIADATTLIEKQLLKKNVSKEVYDKIDKELQKLKYIRLARAGDSYNMERAGKEYTTLIKLLSQINQVYATLYKETFYADIFEDLGSETFKSYTFPTDKTGEKIDDEKWNILFAWLTDFVWEMYVAPFGALQRDWSDASEYVTIDYEAFALMARELENGYRCTHGRQNVCNDGTKDIRESATVLNDTVLEWDGNASWQRIQDATSRLKWALFFGDPQDKKAMEERKQTLLESRYGGAWVPSTRGPVTSLQALGTELLNGAKKSVDPLWFWSKDTTSLFCDEINKRSNQQVAIPTQWTLDVTHEEKDIYTTSSSKKSALEGLASKWENRLRDGGKITATENQLQQNQLRVLESKVNGIQWSFTRYAHTKQEERTKDLLYLDSKIMTKQAVWLSIYVHAAANRFWDYDKKGTINNSLALMCEAQCTNLQGKKCREDQ